jgi:hypothetical protein
MTRLQYDTYIKDTERGPDSPVPTWSLVTRLPELVLIIELGFPPVYSSELPLQAERAIPYLRAIVSSEDLLNAIRHWTWT